MAASLLGLAAVTQPAQALTPLTNGGFETGDLSGWTGVPNGAVTVESSFTCPNGECFGTTVSPVEGTKFALLTPGDVGVYTTLSQTVSAGAGETISGQARFLSQEAPFDTAAPDQAQVVIKDASNNEVATVFSAASPTFSTPWTQWQHTFSEAGTYTVEARVKNAQLPGSPSRLALDDVSLEAADTQAPTVSGVTPTKTKGVSRSKPGITATFSEPVDKTTVVTDPTAETSTNVTLATARGNKVDAKVSCDADPCETVTLTPTKRLKSLTKYTATVSSDVKDLAGNALDQDPATSGSQSMSWSFKTKR